MKITCESCGAKYTIADEKVRGRTVKIRCKKCSSAIVVNGASLAPAARAEEEEGETRIYQQEAHSESAAPPAEWTLNVADGDQRTVGPAEIASLYAEGMINEDTYAWRDGMEDWAPLGQVPELVQILHDAAQAAPQPAPAPAPVAAPVAATASPRPTSRTPGPAQVAEAAAPDARLAGGLLGAAAAGGAARAARRADGKARNQDLFGASPAPELDDGAPPSAAAEPPPSNFPPGTDHYTAERNENSVLFTLDAIKATGGAKPRSFAPPPMGRPGVESEAGPPSGLVDIKKLISEPPPSSGGFDDIANLGAGNILGGAALAAPVLPTTIEPEPPPMQMPSLAPGAPVKSSKAPIVLLAAALVVVLIAFSGFLVFGRGKAATPPAPSGAALSMGDRKPAGADSASPPVADTARVAATGSAPEATQNPGATAPPPGAAAAAGATGKEPAKVKGPLPDPAKAAKGFLQPDKPGTAAPVPTPEKTAAAPPTPATAEPAAAAPAAGPFDRSAAIAALNAAAGAASGCKKPDGPTGTGRVSVTFAPSGRVTSANVDGPPFGGTSVGGCVAARFRSAHVPPFSGSPVTVHKSFTIN
jgi:predicted Zn finger-like uncharacterized protein